MRKPQRKENLSAACPESYSTLLISRNAAAANFSAETRTPGGGGTLEFSFKAVRTQKGVRELNVRSRCLIVSVRRLLERKRYDGVRGVGAGGGILTYIYKHYKTHTPSTDTPLNYLPSK